jgi:hypothetical protein
MTWGGRAYVEINPWMTGADLKRARLQIDFWTKHRGECSRLSHRRVRPLRSGPFINFNNFPLEHEAE